MKAIVVGAGIAGLVTARQLGLAGWDVDVLERSPGPRPDGYMMDFFGPGFDAAVRIGLYPRLADVAYDVEALEYVDAAGRATARLNYRTFARAAGGHLLSLLRPDMERAALAALEDVPAGRVRVHYGASLTRVHADDGGASVGGDGLPGAGLDGDVLVGADGIHSQVRAGLFGPEDTFLRPLGMRAAAFIVHDEVLNARLRSRFILTDSLNRTAGVYGLRSGDVAAFLVYRDPPPGGATRQASRETLRREFAGLGTPVDRVLELCPDHPYDDVVAQVVMPGWTRGRAALVGDACGAVSLLAGQGASLAVAGGALLGELLGAAQSPDGIAPALRTFEHRWRPTVEAAQASGRRAAATFLPASRARRLLRRWAVRGTALPVIDWLVAGQILRSIAK